MVLAFIVRGRQDPMSTSGKMQQYHPILGIQVMTPESPSPLPVTGEGVLSPSGIMEPLMQAAWGQKVDSPRTWHTFSSKVRMPFF